MVNGQSKCVYYLPVGKREGWDTAQGNTALYTEVDYGWYFSFTSKYSGN